MEFIGPPLDEGPLPAVFYFALSANHSLHLDPFNQPVKALESDQLRIFSFTLPLHDVEKPPQSGVDWWREADSDLITPFIDDVVGQIEDLIAQNVVNKEQLGLMGLSRGVFIACHVARKLPIKALLGFAPMLTMGVDHLDIPQFSEQLCQNQIRFYMGNRDKKTSTKTTMDFILSLADHAYEKGLRSSPIELIITPSIGYKGHGTAQETFIEGANWLRKRL